MMRMGKCCWSFKIQPSPGDRLSSLETKPRIIRTRLPPDRSGGRFSFHPLRDHQDIPFECHCEGALCPKQSQRKTRRGCFVAQSAPRNDGPYVIRRALYARSSLVSPARLLQPPNGAGLAKSRQPKSFSLYPNGALLEFVGAVDYGSKIPPIVPSPPFKGESI